ncbi:MAG: flagellar basal-body rod protein FlgF [Chitinispirillales bacterium]|jgi:flagellar basal-body rod protein FlgG|nr:flagellar basal-body rod protein FlgF [Chitinispirillales bacterium]
MIQGLYTASTGMTALAHKQDQIANNLANFNTTGFKQSGLFTAAYQNHLKNDHDQVFANRELKVDGVYIDYTEGAMRSTGSDLDMFIKGSGFFKIMTDDGVRYTRNGNFSLDTQGLIVTNDGAKLMGAEGYIRVEPNMKVTISESGEVIQNGESKGVIKIVDFEKPYELKRHGNSSFTPLDVTGAVELQSQGFLVKQGFLESSNVDLIRNMVKMISTQRNYEADQKALYAQDETLEKAVNMVGKVG